MRLAKTWTGAVALCIGALIFLLGIWWTLQGTGLVAVGFMAGHMQWAWRGLALIGLGIVLAVFARRL